MRRPPSALALSILALLAIGAAPALAAHDADQHTDNLSLVSTFDHDGTYRGGTDLAFWGDTAVLGNFDNPGGFRLVDIADPERPTLLGQFVCPGNQADVAIWEDIVVVSVDQPRVGPECGAAAAGAADYVTNNAWEGVRIVSIADPANPTQVAAVKTDCGSHTHSIVPDVDNDRILIYALSYPISNQGVACNATTHRKISVVEVPLASPEAAKVIATPSVAPAIGCHDVTAFLGTGLAAAACLTESQIWDISDPAEPKVVTHIANPVGMNLAHSTAWSWDGASLVIGDELGGALATPGCLNEGHAPLGALWFYDVSDPSAPVQKAYMQLPQRELSMFCTAHNFNVIPTTERDLLVTGWYNGGTTIIDFTDVAAPQQIAYYTPKTDLQAGSWSSYWYNGFIYSNNYDETVYSAVVGSFPSDSRGLDVFRFDDPVAAAAATLPYLNPQTQAPLPEAEAAGAGDAQVLGVRKTLPATGASAWYVLAIALLGVAGAGTSWVRRGA